MSNAIIYRDDDPNVYTCLHEFKKVNQWFKDRKLNHTVAVVMEDLWENHGLFYYLATEPNIIVELHGWEHKDYSILSYDECFNDLKKSKEYWETNCKRMTGIDKKITTYFAPWNREGDNIKKACEDLGLRFCATKDGVWEDNKIISFHWWSFNGL